MSSVDKALKEISTIEEILRPFEFMSDDTRNGLKGFADLRNMLDKMDKDGIRKAIEGLSTVEVAVAPYRGFRPIEDLVQHNRKLIDELKKILETQSRP